MTDLTPEQEQMLAEARAAKTEEDGPVLSDGRGNEVTGNPDLPAVAERRVQGLDEWGPYPEYKIVPAPTGEFGVEAGKILYFVTEEVFSQREGRMISVQRPKYRLPDEPREDEVLV